MIGTSVQPRRPAHHVEAVDAGQARGRGSRRRGGGRAAQAQRRLAASRPGRPRSPGPAGWWPRARRICGSSSTTRTRVTAPTSRPSVGQARSTIVTPPPGVSSSVELAAHGLDEPRATARPEADAGAGRLRRRGAGTAGRPGPARSGAMPGPRSTTRRSTRPADRAGLDAHRLRRAASSAPRCRRCWRRARSSSAGSAATARQRLGDVDVDAVGRGRLRLASAAGTTSSRPTGPQRRAAARRSAAGSCRAGCRRAC